MRHSVHNRDGKHKLILVVAVLICLVVGVFFIYRWDSQRDRFPEIQFGEEQIEVDGQKYALKENVSTFLFIGLDKFEDKDQLESYVNDKQADFIMLVVLDDDSKTYTAIQINRDTMAQVNVLGITGNRIDTKTQQIALSHTYGNGREVSCRNVADSVSALLKGIKVDHYLSITMDAVPIVNDSVNGVEIEVLDDMSAIDPALNEGETVVLLGEQALEYIRVRQGLEDSSNQSRMERQKQYLSALHKQIQLEIEKDNDFLADLAVDVSDYFVSDRTVTQLQTLSDKIAEYEYLGVRAPEGETKQGEIYIEFYPNEESIEQIVIDLFYEKVSE